MSVYNPWPLGQVPKELQRPELKMIADLGYEFIDARDVVYIFENEVSKFAGSKYAVSVDCCTHAIELSFRYLLHIRELKAGDAVSCPRNTYISVALIPQQLGLRTNFEDKTWSGMYQYGNSRVWDSAVRWQRGMYFGSNALQCLSFQIKKPICIGRGGMILTDDKDAYEWLKLARYDGRDMSVPYNDTEHIKSIGAWNCKHYYMTPEDAARGLWLINKVKFDGDSGNSSMYPDVLSYKNIFGVGGSYE